MGGNLWIGRPGAMLEIAQRGELDRSPSMTVVEHRSLEGQITTWSPRYTPRRIKLSWKWMREADAQHLYRLASGMVATSTDVLSTVAVVAPGCGNMLHPSHGQDSWAYPRDANEIMSSWEVVGGGSRSWYAHSGVANVVIGSTLWWRNTQNSTRAWPTTPGMPMTFAVGAYPGGTAALPAWTAGFQWLNDSRVVLSTQYATGRNIPITGVAPATAAWVRPFLSFNEAGSGAIGLSCLVPGFTADLTATGDGSPEYSVVAFTEAVTQLPYRDVTIELVEVASAA